MISFVLQKSGGHTSIWTHHISSAPNLYAADDSRSEPHRPTAQRQWKLCLHTGPGLCSAVPYAPVLMLEHLSLVLQSPCCVC